MREIKFRAWDKDCEMLGKKGWMLQWSMGDDAAMFWANAVGLPLMQYTGLKDMNGKEIYEGDIVWFSVRADGGNAAKSFEGGAVTIDVCGVCFGQFVATHCYAYDVIGNIYENPELLKETI
jgi:uncharacterized phage protein (TIGR01671 family)